MRTLQWGLLAGLVILGLGCSGGGKSPAEPGSTFSPTDLETSALPGGDAMPGLAGTAALGGYTIQLTPGLDAATTEMWRQGAQTDDIYFLSVDNFLKPSSLRVDSVTRTATTLDLGYTFTHPFAAPTNLAGPATAANRADLGIAARLLFLVDTPGATATGYSFFGGEAIANTDLFTAPDGFFKPAGLLPSVATVAANAFPYKLIVDEAAGTTGNRVGVANGGTGAGNYKPTTGWQGDNIDNSGVNNGWTGYGYLHQGQAATNVVRLDLAALQAMGTLNLDVAVIAKYEDPRGGTTAAQKRANRLPSNPANVTNFIYRMPFGAIDVERVRSLGETGGLIPNDLLSTSTLRFYVRDADARAIVSSRSELSEDPDPTTVPAGTEGVPTLTADVPGVSATPVLLSVVDDDTAVGGDAAPDSGLAFDELYFEGLLQNGQSSGQSAGDVIGMVKAVDPENNISPRNWEFALSPDLTPLSSNFPELVTYQRLRVTLGGSGNLPPTASVQFTVGANPTVSSGGALNLEVTAEDDPEADVVLYDIDMDDDGTFEAIGVDPAGTPPPAIPLYSGNAPTNGTASPVMEQARVRYYDAAHAGTPQTILLPYTVNPAGPNDPPTATVSLLSNSIPSGGSLNFQLDTESDPEGDTVTYAIMYNYVSTFTPDVSGIDPPAPPTSLHLTPALNNPGATPLNRTARVAYSDGVNAPITIDLPYTLGPATCTSQTMTFNFDADSNGWVEGQNFGYGPLLPNTDNTGWGHYRWSGGAGACAPMETVARSGGSLAGNMLVMGDDGDNSLCSFLYDYAGNAAFNMVSPFINVPAICTPGSLEVLFNAVVFARASATARLYVSTDFGATWGTPVWTHTGTGAEQILTNVSVSLPDALAGEAIFLRFEYVDTDTVSFVLPSPFNTSSNSVGLTLDNIRITAGATTPFTNTPPTLPCQARSLVFDFNSSGGWVPGDEFTPALPNTDNELGWGGFGWANCLSTGTHAAVVTASGGAITGNALAVTPDDTFCSFVTDWGGAPNYNVVSPRVVIPPNCSGGTVFLRWNAYLNVDDTAFQGTWEDLEDGADLNVIVRAYVSLDNGVTWGGVPIWTETATLAGQTWLNEEYELTGLAGDPNGVRVRFSFTSTNGNVQEAGPNDPFGFWVDNVRFESSNTNSIYTLF